MILIKALLLYFLIFAQSLAGDQDAIMEITARLEKTVIIQGDFSQQKNLKFLHKPLISSGSFYYHQRKGIIWKTREPVLSLLLIDDSRLLTEHDEPTVPTVFAKVFKAILGGSFAALTDNFNMSVSDKTAAWQIDLTPKDELLQKVITSITLAGDADLRSLVIREASGNSSQISFSNITHPREITPEQEISFEHLSAPR